jgi:ADP-ribose pyrophosphatase
LVSQENPWRTLSNDFIYESDWVRVTKHDVINPAGNKGLYSVVHFKNIAIGVLPLDEQYNTWIVGQFRYPINKYSWEIVEGGGQLDTDPESSAARELFEETGIKASKYTPLLKMELSNSCTDEQAIVFIAQGLTFHESEPEETEQLQVRKVPFSVVFEMVINGEITDAISVAAIYKAKILIENKQI